MSPRIAVLSAAFTAVLSSSAFANELLGGLVVGKNATRWELRLGAGAYDRGPFTADSFSGATLNGEILAPSPFWLAWAGSPRPYLGTDIALSSNPIHIVYGGLNWETHLTERFFLGLSGGAALVSDDSVANADGEVRDLGSHVLFHLQASAGFDITPSAAVHVYLNHFSNADLAEANDGLESMGARFAVRF